MIRAILFAAIIGLTFGHMATKQIAEFAAMEAMQ